MVHYGLNEDLFEELVLVEFTNAIESEEAEVEELTEFLVAFDAEDSKKGR